MPGAKVLIEIAAKPDEAFAMHRAASASDHEAGRQTGDLLKNLAGLGVEPDDEAVPIPMFATGREPDRELARAFSGFASRETSPDRAAGSVVVPAEVPPGRLEELRRKRGVITVWPNSELTLFEDDLFFDLANSRGGVDCRPFRPAAAVAAIRTLLGARRIWADGFRGQNVVVGIIDEGVDGETYPVVGGFARPNAGRRPGTAPVTSHGSMCAADILVAAPAARLYDYPFLGVPRSGGALRMFQAVLDQRRVDGTPHLTNNSYGFVGVPDRERSPGHEVHDANHPLHRKVREVIASGAAAFFAAGNCGEPCPSGACVASGVGAGRSIHASNSLAEVITVAAVNSRHERIGYSSQGPGMFEPNKPDVAAYTHFFGNFGPGRPAGGGEDSFDNGTSAATPVAAGVGALLLSAFPALAPAELKAVLIETAASLGTEVGFDFDHGHGVINAAAAYERLRRAAPPVA